MEEAEEGEEEGRSDTFILKKVMLVRRSTVDFRSCSRSLLLAGKWFYREEGRIRAGTLAHCRTSSSR